MLKPSDLIRQVQAAVSSPTLPVPARPVPRPSALPRPLDLSYASNRTALYGTLVFGGLALLLRRSGRQSLGVGGVAMLAWATGRELDPDDAWSASAALVLAGLAGLSQTLGHDQPAPAVLPGFAALSATRVLSGTVGYAVSAQDAAALSVQGAAAALAGYRVSALMPGAALALSDAQADVLSPKAAWSTPVALGAGLLPGLRHARPARASDESSAAGPNADGSSAKRPRQIVGDLLSLAALSLSAQTLAPEQPSSSCDLAPIQVSASRLQASRALSLGVLALGLLRRESATLLPLAAACLGVGLRRTLKSGPKG